MRRIVLACASLLGLTALAVLIIPQVGRYRAATLEEGVIALTGARIIDGTGAPPLVKATVVIEGGRILAVGPAESVPVPPGARHIRLDGLTILPGLFDSHVHFGAPQVESYADYGRPVRWLPGYLWEKARSDPGKRRALIEHGVTTVVSLGDGLSEVLGLRREIEEERLEGPRIIAAGPIITAPGGHPAGTIFKGNPRAIEAATRQVADPDTARAMVRDLAGAGVDLIKAVYDDGGGDLPRLRPDVLAAVIEEAHRLGLPVAVHWGSADELETALRFGADRFEHAGQTPLRPDVVRLAGEHGATVIPTLAVLESVAPERLRVAMENTRRLHAAGARIVAGTDAANPGVRLGPSIHRELELLVDAGLSPMEAILAATGNAARSIRRGEDLGTLEPGMLADLIAVDGNPLAGIFATRHVRLVIRGGKVLVYESGATPRRLERMRHTPAQ